LSVGGAVNLSGECGECGECGEYGASGGWQPSGGGDCRHYVPPTTHTQAHDLMYLHICTVHSAIYRVVIVDVGLWVFVVFAGVDGIEDCTIVFIR